MQFFSEGRATNNKGARKKDTWKRPRASKKKASSPFQFTAFLLMQKFDALRKGVAVVIHFQVGIDIIATPL